MEIFPETLVVRHPLLQGYYNPAFNPNNFCFHDNKIKFDLLIVLNHREGVYNYTFPEVGKQYIARTFPQDFGV